MVYHFSKFICSIVCYFGLITWLFLLVFLVSDLVVFYQEPLFFISGCKSFSSSTFWTMSSHDFSINFIYLWCFCHHLLILFHCTLISFHLINKKSCFLFNRQKIVRGWLCWMKCFFVTPYYLSYKIECSIGLAIFFPLLTWTFFVRSFSILLFLFGLVKLIFYFLKLFSFLSLLFIIFP